MQVEYASFPKREDRTKYIFHRFGPLFKGKVLDVGCDEALLRNFIPEADYTGIDIGGKPDILVNLEEIERLPFEDNSFDTVLCTDVLEHLNNFHHIFDELVRVTKKNLILSLPNCWVNARLPIARGKGDFSHYGLPIEPPMDRHKWFFNLTEIRHFMQEQAKKMGLEIRELFATEKNRPLPVRAVRRMRYPNKERYLNRYAHTCWTVFEKK